MRNAHSRKLYDNYFLSCNVNFTFICNVTVEIFVVKFREKICVVISKDTDSETLFVDVDLNFCKEVLYNEMNSFK